MKIHWKQLIIGIIIVLQGWMVYIIFHNPYPCSVSGIGCRDMGELFIDTWPDSYFLISVLFGFATILLSALSFETKEDTNENKMA